MKTYTHAERKELSRAADAISARFPHTMVPYSADELAEARVAQPRRNPNPRSKLTSAWRSRTHIAQLYLEGDFLRLSVQRVTDHSWHIRYDRAGGISWDDLQRIKSEVGYGDWWALEVYPKDSEVIDVAPMRHLWMQPTRPAFAWHEGNR